MMMQSLSRSRLLFALAGPILLLQVFLIIPLLLVYLSNTQLESLDQALLSAIQAKTTSAQSHKHCPKPSLADENFHCPVGLHGCASCPRICIRQVQNCDGTPDCPDKSDESRCFDHSGILEKIFSNIINNSRKSSSVSPATTLLNVSDSSADTSQILDNSTHLLQLSRNQHMAGAKPESCTPEDFDKDQCPCVLDDARVIICKGLEFREVPSIFRNTVYKILMSNNKITSIEGVLWPPSLSNLVLANNQISRISNSTFELAPNLSKLYLMQNQISHLEVDAFKGLQYLRHLQLEMNRLSTFDTRMLLHTPTVGRIFLGDNQIDLPEETSFSHCRYLIYLMLDHNRISKIRAHWFSNVSSLGWLSLSHNEIAFIEEKSFEWNYELEELNLSFNRIQVINRQTFATRLNIQRLYLSFNPLDTLPEDSFSELMQLESLNMTGVILNHIHRNTFTQLSQLKFIYFAKFGYCHYANHSRVCRPITDGLSSSANLLVFSVLKYGVWIMACLCTLGNVFVFVWRSVSKREDKILSLFVRYLSVADFLMGIYLFVIAGQDLRFENKYNKYAYEWVTSWGCKAIGFLAIFSSELSVFILMIITIERYRSISSVKPLEEYPRRAYRRAHLYLVGAWLLSFLVASYPLLLSLLLADQDYYSTNGLCIPLHIDQPYTSGWQYSAFVYLGLNFGAVLVMMVLYGRMYTIIMSTRHHTRPALLKADKREDAILALRFYFIVATDCLCWIPVVVIKILALARTDISSAIYGWLVVFIIPINSALNPIIYTLATPSSLREALCRFLDRCCFRLDLLPSLAGYTCCAAQLKKRDSGQECSSACAPSSTSSSISSAPYKKSSLNASIGTQSDTVSCAHLRTSSLSTVVLTGTGAHSTKGSADFLHACLGCVNCNQATTTTSTNRNRLASTSQVQTLAEHRAGSQASCARSWLLRQALGGRLKGAGSEYLATRRHTANGAEPASGQSDQSGQLATSRQGRATAGSKDSRTCLLSNQDAVG